MIMMLKSEGKRRNHDDVIEERRERGGRRMIMMLKSEGKRRNHDDVIIMKKEEKRRKKNDYDVEE